MTSKIDRLARATLALAATALFAGAASATTITGTVNTSAAFSPTNQSADGTTYFNAPYGGAFPAASVIVGEFDFSVPAGSAVSDATISGNFGSNVLGSSTGAVDLYVGAVEVASCDAACANATAANDFAWSYTFASGQLDALASGSMVLSAVQQGGSQIVLDPTSVSVNVAAVPEPAGLPMALAALPLLAAALRRRARSNRA
jgi:hypothetical protein